MYSAASFRLLSNVCDRHLQGADMIKQRESERVIIKVNKLTMLLCLLVARMSTPSRQREQPDHRIAVKKA